MWVRFLFFEMKVYSIELLVINLPVTCSRSVVFFDLFRVLRFHRVLQLPPDVLVSIGCPVSNGIFDSSTKNNFLWYKWNNIVDSGFKHPLSNLNYIFVFSRYQINARTELAIRYNDISPLENHHCAVAFKILSNPECNIFSNVDKDIFKRIRSVSIYVLDLTSWKSSSKRVRNIEFCVLTD